MPSVRSVSHLASNQILRLNGEIWLPNIGSSSDLVTQHKDDISEYFKCELVQNPLENPLYCATDIINETLEMLSDGYIVSTCF